MSRPGPATARVRGSRAAIGPVLSPASERPTRHAAARETGARLLGIERLGGPARGGVREVLRGTAPRGEVLEGLERPVVSVAA